MLLKDIYIYPIKSFSGVRLESSLIDKFGLQYDRRWMLIDQNKNFITQRKVPELCLFEVHLLDEHIKVTHKNDPAFSIEIPYYLEDGKKQKGQVWSDVCEVAEVSKEISQQFAEKLGFPCQLVHMPETSYRAVNTDYAFDGERTSFTDGFPILMISQESLDMLNDKLEEPVPMERFRPNFVIEGATAHVEDSMEDFSIGEADFRGVKPCSRCVVTTINQSNAIAEKEPLRTLNTYRNNEGVIYFGMNVLHLSIGASIGCGDEIVF